MSFGPGPGPLWRRVVQLCLVDTKTQNFRGTVKESHLSKLSDWYVSMDI